jgi:hypothetical protein
MLLINYAIIENSKRFKYLNGQTKKKTLQEFISNYYDNSQTCSQTICF